MWNGVESISQRNTILIIQSKSLCIVPNHLRFRFAVGDGANDNLIGTVGYNTEIKLLWCAEIQKIQRNGGEVEELYLSFPSHTLDDELENYKDIIRKKIRKLPQYRLQGYSRMGLFIVCSSIPIPFRIETLRDLFTAAQQAGTDKFDYILLGYPCAVLFYEESTKQIIIHKVEPQAYDEIAINARLAVEAKFEK